MSSFEECNNNNGKDISSPILFTQSQKSSRKRKFSSDGMYSAPQLFFHKVYFQHLIRN